jgi:hypothetical protein
MAGVRRVSDRFHMLGLQPKLLLCGVASTMEVPLIFVQIGLVGRQKQNQDGIYNLSNSFISIRDYPDSAVVLLSAYRRPLQHMRNYVRPRFGGKPTNSLLYFKYFLCKFASTWINEVHPKAVGVRGVQDLFGE